MDLRLATLKQSLSIGPYIYDVSISGFTMSSKYIYEISSLRVNEQFLYSSTICMLHYDPQHVLSSMLLILRRTNCITTATGIVTLCKQPYSMQVESGLFYLLYLCWHRLVLGVFSCIFRYTRWMRCF